jgi:hypothetical protein
MSDLVFVAKYNRLTGSSITHRDVENWGTFEIALIDAAMDLMASMA